MLAAAAAPAHGREASPESDSSTLSNITVADPAQADSSVAASSTPPTSQADTSSVHSDAPKSAELASGPRRQSTRPRSAVATYNDKENAGTRIHTPTKYLDPSAAPKDTSPHDDAASIRPDATGDAEQPIQRRLSSRPRAAVPTYNDKENAGTRIHTPTKYIDGTYIRKTLNDPIPGKTPFYSSDSVDTWGRSSDRRPSRLRTELTADADGDESDAQDGQSLSRRRSTRVVDTASQISQSVAHASSQMGKHGREALEAVIQSMGSGKKGSRVPGGPAAKRQKLSASSAPPPEPAQGAPKKVVAKGPPKKPWLNAGKFHNTGQDDLVGIVSIGVGHKPKSKMEGEQYPVHKNKVLPLPMFSMAEKLDLYPKKKLPEHKRPFEPFQLPFDVFNPLPKEAKVKDWRELKKNEYKGEDAQEMKQRAKELRKKTRNMEASKCNCTDKCDRESCFNSTLFFECDDSSCKVGPGCGNRQFADLQRRHKDEIGFGKYYKSYNVGVEVIATKERGHGVRAMRTFERDQLVIEYIGEIITQQESDRRMNELYKDHKCFYLMNFYDKLIIDGYRGNIARFVNHSCEPNCRMEKWTVNGEQRMGLFANRFIMTGEELTWHYNFESYGQEQPCYCGSANCAGVIGRQVKYKPAKEPKEAAAGGKRKSPEDAEDRAANKKQKLSNIVASASAKSKTLLTKTKEGLRGIIGGSSVASTPKTPEMNLRAERAARRSLAATEETPDQSSDARPTRSSARMSLSASPKKNTPQTAAKRLLAEESSRRSKSRSSSSARVNVLPQPTPSSKPKATSSPEPVRMPRSASTQTQESSSKAATVTPKAQTTAKQSKDVSGLSTSASKNSNSSSSKSSKSPALPTNGSVLKQSTLAFFPVGLGINRTEATQVVKKVKKPDKMIARKRSCP